MALQLADLGRDRPRTPGNWNAPQKYATAVRIFPNPRPANISQLDQWAAGGAMHRGSSVTTVDRGRRLNRSAIVDEKLADSLTVFVNVAIEQAHVAMLDAVLKQVIRTSLIAQLSPKVLPLLLVYVVFVHAESRNKNGLARIGGIDVRVRQRGHFVHAPRQLVTDAVDGTLNVNRHSLILFLRCSFSITRDD
jgi:hypothetical protein